MTAPAPTQDSTAPTRLTLEQTRGSGYPVLGKASPQAVVDYVKRLLADSEQDALFRYRKATYNLLQADGRQYLDWSKRDSTWRDAPAPEGRVRARLNYIKPILRSRAQRILAADFAWRVVPKDNGYEERDRARVGTNFLTAKWEKGQVDGKVRQALFLADCTGVAYLKSFWNKDIGPRTNATVVLPHPKTHKLTEYPVDSNGTPIMDDVGNPLDGTELAFTYQPGDTDSAVRTIFNVRVNPDAWGLTSGEGFRWLIDSDITLISIIKERYGSKALPVQATDGLASMRMYERIVRSLGGRPLGPDRMSGSMTSAQRLPEQEATLLSEYWEDKSELQPDGRLITVGGEVVLYDGPLPQGFVPYDAILSEPRPYDPNGRPIVDDLVSPQRILNEQWSLALEDQKRQGLGQWIGWDIPGMQDQVGNIDGAFIKVPMKTAISNRSISDVLQRVVQQPTNPDRWRLMDMAKAAMFDIGAFHEIQRGQVPPGVDSGIAVQLLQEAENGQLHDTVRNLKDTLIRWGRKQLKLARWGYGDNESRWIPVHRPDLGFLVESVNGADLPDPDEIDLDLDGFKPTSTAANRADVKELVMNDKIPLRDGLRLMDLGRGVEGAFESQTRHYARARRENLAIEKGDVLMVPAPANTPHEGMPSLLHPEDKGSFLLPADDDHVIHIAIHQDIALDDSKLLPVRQMALLHIAEHRAVLGQPAAPPTPQQQQVQAFLDKVSGQAETAAAMIAAKAVESSDKLELPKPATPSPKAPS